MATHRRTSRPPAHRLACCDRNTIPHQPDRSRWSVFPPRALPPRATRPHEDRTVRLVGARARAIASTPPASCTRRRSSGLSPVPVRQDGTQSGHSTTLWRARTPAWSAISQAMSRTPRHPQFIDATTCTTSRTHGSHARSPAHKVPADEAAGAVTTTDWPAVASRATAPAHRHRANESQANELADQRSGARSAPAASRTSSASSTVSLIHTAHVRKHDVCATGPQVVSRSFPAAGPPCAARRARLRCVRPVVRKGELDPLDTWRRRDILCWRDSTTRGAPLTSRATEKSAGDLLPRGFGGRA